MVSTVHKLNVMLNIGVLFIAFSVPPVWGEGLFDRLENKFDGLIDKMADKFEDKADKQIDKMELQADKAMDKTFEKVDEMGDCLVEEEKCPQDEVEKTQVTEKPSTLPTQPVGALNVMKCVATDVPCLMKAQTLGKQVAIVNEEDLDIFSCSVTNVACLQKAQKLGKPVQLVSE